MPTFRAFPRDVKYLSSLVYLDTCFGIAASLSDQRYHPECTKLAGLLTTGKYKIVYSDFLFMDAWNGLVNLYVDREFQKALGGPHGYGLSLYEFKTSHPMLLKELFPEIANAYRAFTFLFKSFPRLKVPLTSEIRASAFNFMRDFGLYPADAVHAATAASVNAMDLITLDSDYAVLPKDFSVWNPDPVIGRMERSKR